MRTLSTLFALLASVMLSAATCVHGSLDLAAMSDESTVGETVKSAPRAVLTRGSATQLASTLKLPPLIPARAAFVDAEQVPVFGGFEWSALHPRILSVTAGPVTERGPPALVV